MSGMVPEKRGSASTVKACDSCRKRKRRCIWTPGTTGCTICVNLKEECTTTHVRRPRSKPQKGNRIAEYEKRIKQLESLIQKRSAEQPQIRHEPLQQSIRPSMSPSTCVENLRHEFQTMPRPDIPASDPFDTDALAELTSFFPPSLVAPLDLHKTEKCVSPSISYASLPTQDLQTSSEFEADSAYLKDVQIGATDSTSTVGTGTTATVLSPATFDWYFPPPEVATSLLAEFLNDFNTATPLYQPDVLANYLRICYAECCEDNIIAWTSAYVVFGLAHTLRAMSPVGTTQDTYMAQYYLDKTLMTLRSLLSAPASLGLVQCLLGVALLITRLPIRYNINEGQFIATASRIIQGLAYEPCTSDMPLLDYASSAQQQRRVFWLAFIGDTMTSIITNSPTTYRHEDVMECSPEMAEFLLDPLGAVTSAEGYWQINIFNLRVKLALLQAEANDQILTSRPHCMKSPAAKAASATVLRHLEEFHKQEVFTLGVNRLFQLLYRSDICHVVTLEATYFATVYRLHAFAAFEEVTGINPFSLEGLKMTAGLRENKCYGAAHRLLSLLPIAPRGDVGLYWNSHISMIAALVTVLAQHINDPAEAMPSSEEFEVYNQFLVDLGTMAQAGGNWELLNMREFCVSLFLKIQRLLPVWSSEGSAHFDGLSLNGTPSSEGNHSSDSSTKGYQGGAWAEEQIHGSQAHVRCT
ncbi:hypothetical protein IAQ61_002535 [Plenodomus lingam]|uniref:Zn(2)-C6 fungal-type domain-containing protein n=1 Tax=Leptosphaeria maculans (strain JN3 / isolate v23.1.3 / race Av1-4-5-6-7-8) TaxID=985895 RepID=E4ZIP8_LEPMJ|nr:hypothetical protein LEMA_P061030.1 [Plenodomus lingam JN3]KAH9877172.1 hypothetical protein IAQ61_002535 [Plenodomus lingam]CBX91069.1 hypothetical protein LEMA_P061030.1 [Plenodomus lingam JN3]